MKVTWGWHPKLKELLVLEQIREVVCHQSNEFFEKDENEESNDRRDKLRVIESVASIETWKRMIVVSIGMLLSNGILQTCSCCRLRES